MLIARFPRTPDSSPSTSVTGTPLECPITYLSISWVINLCLAPDLRSPGNEFEGAAVVLLTNCECNYFFLPVLIVSVPLLRGSGANRITSLLLSLLAECSRLLSVKDCDHEGSLNLPNLCWLQHKKYWCSSDLSTYSSPAISVLASISFRFHAFSALSCNHVLVNGRIRELGCPTGFSSTVPSTDGGGLPSAMYEYLYAPSSSKRLRTQPVELLPLHSTSTS